MKAIGASADFFTSLRGVRIIKQDNLEGGLSIATSSYFIFYSCIVFAQSIGFFPDLSMTSLEAPLINKDLTGLALFNKGTLLTARCKGVYPSLS